MTSHVVHGQASELEIATPHHRLKAYLAIPAGQGPWPGVVVLHDAMGFTPVTKEHAHWLAREGFIAVVPDLYSWGGTLRCIRTTIKDIVARKGQTFDDVDAVREWLLKRPDCTEHIGVIGFCMSGGFAILLAAEHGFSAVSANYGQVPGDIESILAGACPVVASYGKKDRLLPNAATKLRFALDKLGIDNDVREYPDAHHSFMDNHKGLLPFVMSILFNTKYKEDVAEDAKRRIVQFFRRHLM